MRRSAHQEAARPAAATPAPFPTGTDLSALPAGVVHASKPVGAAVERLTLRLEDIAKALGISRRALERERSAGRFPRPDLTIGRMPLWRPETIRAWVEGGGRP